MPPVEDSEQPAGDAELITRVRAGDRTAFGDLYDRHAGAASALARQFAGSAAEADDLVSEAFARVLDGMLVGKGPDLAFRAYLFTTLRNTAYDRTRKDRRIQFTDDIESHDIAVESDDPVIAELETGLIGRAFAGLPERWQTVLWHTQVEGQSAAEVGAILGMAPNAVSSLAFRAREGLREAYLQAHLAETAAEQCRATVDRLGAWTRGGLSKRERAQVDAHLEHCDRCPALATELSEINTSLRGLLAPLLLGGVAAGYIATLGPVAPLSQLGALVGEHTAAGAGHGAGAGHSAGAGSTPSGAGNPAAGAKAGAVGTKAGGVGAGTGGGQAGGQLATGLINMGGWGTGATIAGFAAVAAVVVAGVVIALSGSKSQPPVAAGTSAVSPATTTGRTTGTDLTNGGTRTGEVVLPANPAPSPNATTPANSAPPSSSARPSNSAAPVLTSGTGSDGATTAAGRRVTLTTPPLLVPTTMIANIVPITTAGTTEGSTAQNSTSTSGTTSTSTTSTSTTSTSTTSTSAGSSSTSSTTATSTPTTPAVGPKVGVDPANSSVSANLAAGGAGTLTLRIGNTGDTVSTAGQLVQITAPDGFTLTNPTATPGLRRSAGAFAARADSAPCTSTGSGMSCPLPAIAANSTLTLSLTIQAEVTAAPHSFLQVRVDDGPVTRVAVDAVSGFTSLAVSSDPLGTAAVNAITLKAELAPGITDGGTLTLPRDISPHMRIVGIVPAAGASPALATPACTMTASVVVCPSAAVTASEGARLAVLVDRDAASGAPLPAIDQGFRTVSPTGMLIVSANPTGGYRSVGLGPVGLLRAGSTVSMSLVGVALNDGVVNPGPITVPVDLTAESGGPGLTITAVPAGCLRSDGSVTCSPAAGGSLAFPLTVSVAPAATGDQSLAEALLPAGSTALVPAGGTPVRVDPTLTGYDSITVGTDVLDAAVPGSLIATAVPGRGVSDPGDVTFHNDLGKGVTISGAATGNCAVGSTTTVCTPDAGNSPTTWKLAVSIAPTAAQDRLTDPTVTLPGRRSLATTRPAWADPTVRAAATSCDSPAATLDNGDFETPVVPPGGGQDRKSSAATVWQTTAKDDEIEFWHDGDLARTDNHNVPITAQSGDQWVELNANYASALYQDVATVPGQVMRWTIWHRARSTSVANGIDTMKVEIGAGATSLGDQIPDGQSTADISDGPAKWVEHTGRYTVPAGQTTTRFQFSAVSTSSGDATVGNFLDHISFATVPCLTATTSVVNRTSVDQTGRPGDRLTYTVKVRNDGGDTATGVTLYDDIPAGTTFVAGSLVIDGRSADPAVAGFASGLVTARLGPGGSGEMATGCACTSTVTFDVLVGDGPVPITRISDNAVVRYLWSPPGTPLTSVSNTVISSISAG